MSRCRFSFAVLSTLPLRWRLALASYGLLTLLLILLGLVISATEEQTLLGSQAEVVRNEARIAQSQLQATKTQPTKQQMLRFPGMSKELASSYAGALQSSFGQDVKVSLLSFDGKILATGEMAAFGSSAVNVPTVVLPPSPVQDWLSERSSSLYLLANDASGQRNLVVLVPVAGWDKSALVVKGDASGEEDLGGYRKALLQLSVPTTAIDQAVQNTHLILALGILIALGLAGALTLPLINLALRPLVEMEQVSSYIAAGALDQRLTEPGAKDEIGRLAHAFNHMVARLEKAFAQQKRFVADVSHELRTPLTGLGGSLEMLLLGADNGDPETTHKLVRGMYAEVERMQRLVADLLALARLDEGRLKPRLERIEVVPFLGGVCEQVQEMLAGQTFSCQISPILVLLWGDSDQLKRVLLNILENACKYTPSYGKIELRMFERGEQAVVIEVQDTGVGIAPEDLPRVFDRFYRADASRTRLSSSTGGSGLGLSLAKELVEAHQGTITINSTLAVGTTVKLVLPARREGNEGVPG